jgi:uncharacterized protein (TIGR01244 family)
MVSPFPFQPLSPDACASPQLEPQAMQSVAQAGFRSVINNRPDFEGGPTQPTHQALQEAALNAGLEYAYLPVTPGQITDKHAHDLAVLLTSLPKPVLLFCRSGARSSYLYQLANQA